LFLFFFKLYNSFSSVNFFFFIEKLIVQFYLHRYVSILWFALQYKSRFLVKGFNLVPQYFLIGNNDINATFLSRYIAKMLDYNNALRRVLNPLKREFKMVVKDTKIVPNLNKLTVNSAKDNSIKYIYYSFLFNFLLLCKIFYDKYFSRSDIWLTLNDFVFLTDPVNGIETRIFFRKFFLQRPFFSVLNSSGDGMRSLAISNFKNRLFSYLFIEGYCSKCVLFSDFVGVANSFNVKLARYSFASSKDFFDLQYSMFDYYSLAQFSGINNLKTRIKSYKFSAFTGFKIQCLGRFSRKQRSTSFWFSLGKVPLNSTAAPINYGYYTLPLRNSAITVKA
jgi:hypothetical protein